MHRVVRCSRIDITIHDPPVDEGLFVQRPYRRDLEMCDVQQSYDRKRRLSCDQVKRLYLHVR